MNKGLIALTLLSALIAQTLTLSFPHHLQGNLGKQAYLNTLLAFEAELAEKANQIQTLVDQTLNISDSLWGYDNLERVTLQEGLASERDVLLEIRTKVNSIDSSVQSTQCKNLTQQEIDRLNEYKAKLEEIELSQSISSGSCLRETELSYLLQNLKLTLQNLNSQLSNTCSPPKIILPNRNISNLTQASNYILAGLTAQTLAQRNEKLKTQFNVVSCPLDRPYVINGSCGVCDTIYNVSSEECLTSGCPKNTHFEKDKKACIDNFKVLNLEQSSGNYIYGNLSKEQVEAQKLQGAAGQTTTCPPEQPYISDDNQCISCPEEKVYNISLKTCTTCPVSTVLNKTSHSCEIEGHTAPTPLDIPVSINKTQAQCVGSTEKWNGTHCVLCEAPGYFKDVKCICPDSYLYNFQLQKCETREEICTQDNLFWNGTVCIKCEFPGNFVYKTKTCQCPEKQTYNQNKQTCVFGNGTIVKVPNIVANTNWIYGEHGLQGYQDEITKLNSETTTSECPASEPYPNVEGVCVTCGVGELYDLSSKLCTKCPEKTQLDAESHKCISEWQIMEQKCPDSAPYWNGTGCINCVDPGKLVDHICQCPENYQYNWKSLSCVKNKIKYIPNFSSKNWTYGTMDELSYQKFIESNSSEYILEKCPTENPFPSNSGDCISCQQDKIFDVSTGFCISCPEGQSLNQSSHYCVQTVQTEVVCPDEFPYYTGTTCIKCSSPGTFNKEKKECECPAEYFYNQTSKTCSKISSSNKNSNSNALNFYGDPAPFDENLKTCPIETPFFDGVACIACNFPNYFDFSKQKCQICENGLIFDIATKSCIAQKEKPVEKMNSWLKDNVTNYCCGAPPANQSLKTCPPEKPFFNNAECVACGYPAYFDFATSKCQFCIDGQTFSDVLKKCIDNKYLQAQTQSNLDGVSNYYGSPPEIDETYLVVKKCPKQNPYYNGAICLKCELPHFFNFVTKKCASCPFREEFSVEQKKCVKKQLLSGYKNNYLVDADNFAGNIPTYDPQYETCDKAMPFFDGKNCIKCELPKYFNMTEKSCVSCPTDNYFNIINKQCEFSNQKFITNLKSDDIYYNGDYQQIIAFNEAKKKGNPSIQDCPAETPYYQARADKCISCPKDKPLFNMKYNECIACGPESYFSIEKHVCVSNGMVRPTVERMIMNVF